MTFIPSNNSALKLSTPGFADLTLNGSNTDAAGNTFTIETVDEDADWGTPEAVDVAVQRWMTDGAVAATQGHENRQITFKVRLSATTSAALPFAEAALALRSAQPGSLKWTPPSATTAPVTVFEAWTWHLDHTFDSVDDRHLQRIYTVTMTAKPWVRSDTLTTVTANTTSASPTITSIDTCSSLTGWTGSPDTPTVVGGTAIQMAHTFFVGGGSAGWTPVLSRAATVSGLGSLPYLAIDMSFGGVVTSATFNVRINGTTFLTKVGQVGTTSYWALPASTTSFTGLDLILTAGPMPNGQALFKVNDVSAASAVAAIGSGLQTSRTMPVGGSVKTSGSIQIASPSATNLGSTLIYTYRDDTSGYTPPLRQYRTSGNTVTADATCVSGFHEALVTTGASAGTITYTIPADRLPEGTYAIVGRFIFGAPDTMTLTAKSNVAFNSGQTTTVGTVTRAIAGGVKWGVVGTMTLPPGQQPAESTTASILTLSATGTGSNTHTLDELYVFDVTPGHGALTWVDQQVPNFTRLWIDAPDANQSHNRPGIYVGTASDRSDAATPFYTAIQSIGDHDLDPGGAAMLVVTDNVANAVVTASFYQRWHTHAGA